MTKWIVLNIIEIGLIALGWIAWLFKPEAVVAIAIGWGVAGGVAIPHLLEEIQRIRYFQKHKKEIMEDAAKALSAKLGKEIKPEDFEDIEHGEL